MTRASADARPPDCLVLYCDVRIGAEILAAGLRVVVDELKGLRETAKKDT